MIYCLFGQPGSGKTTIANALIKQLQSTTDKWAIIDGDHIRELFDNKDYSREGRIRNINFGINLAKYLVSQDINVIMAMVMPYREMRNNLRKTLPEVLFFELTYDITEGRRNPDYLVKDYESEENSDTTVINTSIWNIGETIQLILQSRWNTM